MIKYRKNNYGFSLIEMLISLSVFSFIMIICVNLLDNVNKSQRVINASAMQKQSSYNIKDKLKREIQSVSYLFPPDHVLPPGFIDDRYIPGNSKQNNYESKLIVDSDVVDMSNNIAGGKISLNGSTYYFKPKDGDSLYYISDKTIDVKSIIAGDGLDSSYPVPDKTKMILQTVNFLYLKENTSDQLKKTLKLSQFKDMYLYKGEEVDIEATLISPIPASSFKAMLPVITIENSYSYTKSQKLIARRNLLYRLFNKGYKITIENSQKPYNMLGVFPPTLPIPTIAVSQPSLRSVTPKTDPNTYGPMTYENIAKVADYSLSQVMNQQRNVLMPTFNLALLNLPLSINGPINISSINPSYGQPIKSIISDSISKEPILDYTISSPTLKIRSRTGLLFSVNTISDTTPAIKDVINFKQIDSYVSNIQVSINLFTSQNNSIDFNNKFSTTFMVETFNNRNFKYSG